jgi:hypothetical protein
MVTATVTVTKDHTLTWLLAGPALLWSLQNQGLVGFPRSYSVLSGTAVNRF